MGITVEQARVLSNGLYEVATASGSIGTVDGRVSTRTLPDGRGGTRKVPGIHVSVSNDLADDYGTQWHSLMSLTITMSLGQKNYIQRNYPKEYAILFPND